MDGQDDAKGGRYLKYRPGWTVFQIPSTPGCLRAVGSVLCGSDWKHLNPRLLLFLFEIDLERRLPHQSRAAAGGRRLGGRWLRRTSADFLTSPATVASVVRAGNGRVRSSAASALATAQLASGEACPVPRSLDGGGRAARTGGGGKLLALELERPRSLDLAWYQRRACLERVAAAVLLLRRGVWSSLSGPGRSSEGTLLQQA